MALNRPTMNDIAESLGVSRVTVWKALNNKPGVSEDTRERIKKHTEELWTRRGHLLRDEPSGRAAFNVSLVVSRAYSSVFWTKIINQIATDLGKRRINFVYNPLDTVDRREPSNTAVLSMLNGGASKGIIVVNIYDEQILREIAAIDVPKVFLDTVPGLPVHDLRGDVVLLDGVRTMATITTHVLQRGCRRLAFVGDTRYAKTNELRWQGFLAALAGHRIEPDPAYCLTGPLGVTTHEEEIDAFIGGLPGMPDAIICVNDYLAYLVADTLSRRRLDDENRIVVTGYDDSPEFIFQRPAITTVHVQNEIIGSRLVSQLLFRIEHPDADLEEILVYPTVRFRD